MNLHACLEKCNMCACLLDYVTEYARWRLGIGVSRTGVLLGSDIVRFVFFVFYIFSSRPCCTRYIPRSIRPRRPGGGVATRWKGSKRPDGYRYVRQESGRQESGSAPDTARRPVAQVIVNLFCCEMTLALDLRVGGGVSGRPMHG